MKKFIFAYLSIVFFAACQVIPEDKRTIAFDQKTGEATVLLTEFTGVGCVNCPNAAQEAEKLKQTLGNQLVVVAMHPASNPFTKAVEEYDYTAPAVDEYYRYFQGTPSTPFPTGVINFMKIDGSYFQDYTAWGNNVLKQLNQQSEASLDMDVNLLNRKLTIETRVQSKREYSLLLWLVESNINGAQMMPDGSLNTDYIHNHVFREALNGVWGEKIQANGFATGEYDVSNKYDLNNCAIVGVLLDDDKQVVAVKEISFPDQQTKFLFSINGIGDITNDTVIEVSDVQINPLTKRPEIELHGMLAYEGTLKINIDRDNSDSDDQFCCGDKCTSTNWEKHQEMSFSINGISNWFTHVAFDQPAEYTILYTLNADSEKPVSLTIKYIYK